MLVALKRGQLIQRHSVERRRARPANPRDQRAAFGDDDGLVVRQQVLRIADQAGDAHRVPAVLREEQRPEAVAQRLVKYAEVVGRENVIAGTDCGFATFAGADEIHASIVWAKFDAMVQGAQIASRELW